jgi:hypothetical protein
MSNDNNIPRPRITLHSDFLNPNMPRPIWNAELTSCLRVMFLVQIILFIYILERKPAPVWRGDGSATDDQNGPMPTIPQHPPPTFIMSRVR